MALLVRQLTTNFIAKYPDIESDLYRAASSDSGYDATYKIFNNYVEEIDNKKLSVRILVSLADGTVMMDTSKGEQNKYSRFKRKEINENHNSRLSILQALLIKSGEGYEEKFSTSTNQTEEYYAIRTGSSTQRGNFTIRFSLKL